MSLSWRGATFAAQLLARRQQFARLRRRPLFIRRAASGEKTLACRYCVAAAMAAAAAAIIILVTLFPPRRRRQFIGFCLEALALARSKSAAHKTLVY